MTLLSMTPDCRLQSAALPRDELDELLATSQQQTLVLERHAFDRVAGPFDRDLVLFGAGKLGRYVLARLRSLGIEPLAFVDNARHLHGTDVLGVPVLSAEDAAARYGDRATFVQTILGGSAHIRRYGDVREQLRALRCRRYAPAWVLFWKYPDVFLPYYCVDLPSRVLPHATAIRSAFDLMADDFSRREFVAHVRWRLCLDIDRLSPPVPEEMYFAHSLYRPIDDETFVDCGAYDGDTLRAFLARKDGAFAHYVAIEPDPTNHGELAACVASLPDSLASRIAVHRLAVGERRATLRFDPTGTADTQVNGSGAAEVECVPLDELLADRIPTAIKMDVEGAEPGALRGARRVIAGHSPLLAICLYHAQDHLWTIPNLIRELNPDYRIYLRPHVSKVWDFVCYAVPSGRLAVG